MPAVDSDYQRLTEINNAAFSSNPLTNAIVARATATPKQWQDYVDYRQNDNKRRMQDTNTVFYKAVDTQTGQMVGYAQWRKPTPAGTIDKDGADDTEPPAILDRKAFAEVLEKVMAMKAKHMTDVADCWYLASFAVDPAFKGRGIAGQLMEHAVEVIDQCGTEAYLESTPAAFETYRRHGFVVVDRISLLDGTYVLTCMLRPKGRSKMR